MKPSFTEQDAKNWTSNFKNTDGTTGPHWSIKQTEIVKTQRNIQWDQLEFWVAMNLVYSKYGEIFRTYGVRDQIFLYADIAYAFLNDKDASPGKLASYFTYVVNR